MDSNVSFKVGPKTQYVISTSGRVSSLQRYAKFLQELLALDVAYLPIHSGDPAQPAIDPARYTQTLRGLPCLGGAISKDIKHSIIPFLDEVDELAAKVQSVNTVVVGPQQRLKGYNTDMLGFKLAIESGIARVTDGKPVQSAVCYGYGGVTYVVVSVLQGLGLTVYLAGRDLEKASARATELGVAVWAEGIACDVFVNATPASEHPLADAPNFLSSLSSARVVFDHEMPGRYLRDHVAGNSDVVYVPGTEMYYPQMVQQWALFLQHIAPDVAADHARLRTLLQQAEKDLR